MNGDAVPSWYPFMVFLCRIHLLYPFVASLCGIHAGDTVRNDE